MGNESGTWWNRAGFPDKKDALTRNIGPKTADGYAVLVASGRLNEGQTLPSEMVQEARKWTRDRAQAELEKLAKEAELANLRPRPDSSGNSGLIFVKSGMEGFLDTGEGNHVYATDGKMVYRSPGESVATVYGADGFAHRSDLADIKPSEVEVFEPEYTQEAALPGTLDKAEDGNVKYIVFDERKRLFVTVTDFLDDEGNVSGQSERWMLLSEVTNDLLSLVIDRLGDSRIVANMCDCEIVESRIFVNRDWRYIYRVKNKAGKIIATRKSFGGYRIEDYFQDLIPGNEVLAYHRRQTALFVGKLLFVVGALGGLGWALSGNGVVLDNEGSGEAVDTEEGSTEGSEEDLIPRPSIRY